MANKQSLLLRLITQVMAINGLDVYHRDGCHSFGTPRVLREQASPLAQMVSHSHCCVGGCIFSLQLCFGMRDENEIFIVEVKQ